MSFTIDELRLLLSGGMEKAMGDGLDSFIAFYSFIFDDSDPCTTCERKLRGYWDAMVLEGMERLTKKLGVMANKKEKMKKVVLDGNAAGDDLQVADVANDVAEDVANDVAEDVAEDVANDVAEDVAEDVANDVADKVCSFRLRAGINALAMDFGSNEYFNNDTLTDEVALRYLAINRNRIANFEVFPDDWESLLEV